MGQYTTLKRISENRFLDKNGFVKKEIIGELAPGIKSIHCTILDFPGGGIHYGPPNEFFKAVKSQIGEQIAPKVVLSRGLGVHKVGRGEYEIILGGKDAYMTGHEIMHGVHMAMHDHYTGKPLRNFLMQIGDKSFRTIAELEKPSTTFEQLRTELENINEKGSLSNDTYKLAFGEQRVFAEMLDCLGNVVSCIPVKKRLPAVRNLYEKRKDLVENLNVHWMKLDVHENFGRMKNLGRELIDFFEKEAKAR